MAATVEVRCPVYTRRLFLKIVADGVIDRDSNTIEVACGDCRKARRQQGEPVTLVVHEFNLLGACIRTTVT